MTLRAPPLRKIGAVSSHELSEAPATWRTCIREIVFVPGPDCTLAIRTDRRRLDGASAYGYLLEVICGLRSPLAGETQVQGQFKSFIEALEPARHPALRRLGQRLLADAKAVREAHLRGLGSRSYGAAVRRHLDVGARMAMVGAGALAAELMPYLAASGPVDVWSRREPKAISSVGADVLHRSLANPWGVPVIAEPAILIVAAPVDAPTIGLVASRYASLVRVLDLRAHDERTRGDVLDLDVPVITLDDVFAEASRARATASRRLAGARAAIATCAAAWAGRAQLRPHGWDDLCA